MLSSQEVEIGFTNPILKSLAKVEIGRCANHEIFFVCPDASVIWEINDGTLKPLDYLDGWTEENPKSDPEVGRAILIC